MIHPEGTVPTPALDEAFERSRRKPVQREHKFQAWADRFIDRAVLPPMFTTGLDHAHQAMQHVGRRATLQARGVKFGLPDVFVCQAPGCSVWLELKRGSSVSSAQQGVHRAMGNAGQRVVVCRSVQDVLGALRATGFALHGNADNMAAEYDARLDASESAPRKATTRQHKPRPAQKRRGGITSQQLVFGG